MVSVSIHGKTSDRHIIIIIKRIIFNTNSLVTAPTNY